MTVLVVALGSCSVTGLAMITSASAARTAKSFEHEDSYLVSATFPAGTHWEASEADLVGRIPADLGAGTFTTVNQVGASVSSISAQQTQVSMVIATSQGLNVAGTRTIDGMGLPEPILTQDPYHVLLGVRLAKELNANAGDMVRINDQELYVDGVVADLGRRTLVSISVVIAPETAVALGIASATERTLILRGTPQTLPGLREALPLMLSPTQPESIRVTAPQDPDQLKRKLLADANNLVAIVASIMVIATIGTVVTTTTAAVRQRRPEIGVVFALGGRSWAVVRMLGLEALLTGIGGGAAGWALGVVATGTLLQLLGWSVVYPLWLWLVPVGAAVTSITGVSVPALRAARIQPIELIRS